MEYSVKGYLGLSGVESAPVESTSRVWKMEEARDFVKIVELNTLDPWLVDTGWDTLNWHAP